MNCIKRMVEVLICNSAKGEMILSTCSCPLQCVQEEALVAVFVEGTEDNHRNLAVLTPSNRLSEAGK